MSRVADALSLALAAAGVFALIPAFPFGARWRPALPIAMELWTAAGLLRLVGERSWTRIASAAAIVAVRRLILLRVGRR